MKSLPLCLVALSLLPACAGSPASYGASASYAGPLGAQRAVHVSGGYASAAAPAMSPASAPLSRTGTAVTQESEAPAGGAVDVAPQARPGLATTWGEDLRSTVRYSQFERGSEAPIDTATIWYNDAQVFGMQLDHAAAQAHLVTLGPRQDGLRVSLRDESGTPLRGATVSGRTFILGSSGQRYTILLENRTGASFEAVVTVDGLDVVSGQTGSFANRGYVIRPYGQVEIRGFRQSLDRVAAFRFGSVGDSYAADRGDARNVGVIGVALFAERGATWDLHQNEVELRDGASPFPNGFAPPPRRW